MSEKSGSTHLEEKYPQEKGDVEVRHVDKVGDNTAEAMEAEAAEHNMGLMEAVRAYPMACFWAFVMSFTIVMESFDMFLIGNFIALPAFKEKYGTLHEGAWVIPTKWQSALTMAGQIGALLGIFVCGPITNRWGYRIATMVGLVLMNATIFISFFGNSLPVFLVGQLLEGLPWGFFIANAPAFASEISPIALRSVATAYLQMCWAIGSIIVGASTYALNQRADQWAYRIPFALQWLFPTPLLILMIFMPESPWWLVRKGRLDQARVSIRKLGRKGAASKNVDDTLAMMVRTVEIETQTTAEPTYLDLFRGIDLRRTLIIGCIYAGQNLGGNLIANQAVFFFEQAGMSTDFSFQLGLITSCLQMVAVGLSWFLSSYWGRRTIYLYGTAANMAFLFSLGIVAAVSKSKDAQFAQACLGVIISFVFALTLGPISYTIIAETSSVHLRPLSTGFGRACYYVVEIPCIYLASQMLNPTGWNLAGKCGFVWGGTATVCFILAWFALPEMRGRSYREIDVLFHRKTPARKFASTHIDARDMH